MAGISTTVLVLFCATLDVTSCLSFGPKIESKPEDVSVTSNADQSANCVDGSNQLMTTMVDLLQKQDQIMNNVVRILEKYDDAFDDIKQQLHDMSNSMKQEEQQNRSEESNMASALLNITERTLPTEETEPFLTPTEEPTTAKDCDEIYNQGNRKNGIYTINPYPSCTSQSSIQVYCDLETICGGWTVIQQRYDGSVNFNTNWDDYKNGFGKLPGEHWIGLDNLNRLTTMQGLNRLRVELEDYNGKTTYVEYSGFSVADESTYYKLSYSSYLGIGGNSLGYGGNALMAFSTYDNDHTRYQNDCAETYTGGWWFSACGEISNLNGLYYKDPSTVTEKAMRWDEWKGGSNVTALRRAEMKIRH